MKLNDIFKDVALIIDESCGIEAESIKLENTLFDELEIDSIDMVDILFEIETKYDISLKVGDLENRTKNQDSNDPYEIEGKITESGVASILKEMPEIDLSKVKPGLTIEELVKLINVHSLCKIIKLKLDEKEQA